MVTNKLEYNRIRSLYWDKNYNLQQIAKTLNVSVSSLHNFMQKSRIPRRSFSEAGYIAYKDKPQFKSKKELNIPDRILKTAGVMLYWAEGTLKGNTVDFANSNPEMIKIFMKFLRDICGVSEERLRVYLYAYQYQKIDEIKLFWNKVTKIPLGQFTKPYVRSGNVNSSQRKLPHGLIHIRYNDKRLLELIKNWIDEYIQWAGGGAANRTRLCKSSLLSKESMEQWVNSGNPSISTCKGNPEPRP